MTMKKIKIILTVLITILVVLVVCFLIRWQSLRHYSIVYLWSGADPGTYVGRFINFPKPILYDAYLLTSDPDSETGKKNLRLSQIGGDLLALKKLNLSRSQIIFTSRLADDGDVVNSIKQAKK